SPTTFTAKNSSCGSKTYSRFETFKKWLRSLIPYSTSSRLAPGIKRCRSNTTLESPAVKGATRGLTRRNCSIPWRERAACSGYTRNTRRHGLAFDRDGQKTGFGSSTTTEPSLGCPKRDLCELECR